MPAIGYVLKNDLHLLQNAVAREHAAHDIGVHETAHGAVRAQARVHAHAEGQRALLASAANVKPRPSLGGLELNAACQVAETRDDCRHPLRLGHHVNGQLDEVPRILPFEEGQLLGFLVYPPLDAQDVQVHKKFAFQCLKKLIVEHFEELLADPHDSAAGHGL